MKYSSQSIECIDWKILHYLGQSKILVFRDCSTLARDSEVKYFIRYPPHSNYNLSDGEEC